MTLRKYVATYGDRGFSLRGQALDTRISIYGSDPARGCCTDLTADGWMSFADLTAYALAHGATHIEHDTWPDGRLHTDLIRLEPEAARV